MANNRELSQFASFVEVGISSIGITTSVGIGKTNPQFDLDVAGDINFTGTFYQGGSQFIASRWSATGSDIYRLSKVGINTSIVSSTLTVNGNVNVSGVVTATTFVGGLTGTASSTTNIPNLTGDISSVNTTTTLATVNSNVGTFGSSVSIPSITVNAKGLITGITTNSITVGDGTLTLSTSGTGLSGSASFTANQSGAATFTVTSNATNANTASAIVARDASGNFSAGTITASLTGTATTTTNIPNLTGAITSNNTTTSLGSFTSANLATALTDETGSGAAVFATSPTLVTPVLGAATATSINASGAITANSYNVGTDVGISTTRTTVATTAVTTIDSFATATFRSTRAQVQITQSTNYQASDVLIIHDGTTASIIEYGSIATNDYLGTFSASVSGGNCLLRINMSSATSATVKVLSQRITV